MRCREYRVLFYTSYPKYLARTGGYLRKNMDDILEDIKSDIAKITSVKDSRIKLSLENNLKKLEEQIKIENLMLQKKVINLQEQIITNNEHYNEKLESFMTKNIKTYAQATTTINKIEKQIPQKHAIIISTTKNLKAEEMKKRIEKNIDVTKMQVGVTEFKKIGDQKLIISCLKKEDAQKMVTKINGTFGEDINAEETKKRKPIMIVKRLQSDLSEDEIVLGIIQQNEGLQNCRKDDFKLIKEIKLKKFEQQKTSQQDISNYLLQTSGAIRKILVNIGKINIKYQRVPIDDLSPLTQCYHCLKYGHTALRCLNRTQPPTCPHCAQDHTLAKCTEKNNKPICYNCSSNNIKYKSNISDDHRADSINCTYRQKMLQIAKERVEYE